MAAYLSGMSLAQVVFLIVDRYSGAGNTARKTLAARSARKILTAHGQFKILGFSCSPNAQRAAARALDMSSGLGILDIDLCWRDNLTAAKVLRSFRSAHGPTCCARVGEPACYKGDGVLCGWVHRSFMIFLKK